MRIWHNVHRYLGVIIGIQLLFWTLSGLMFSFSPIEKVRGEHLVRSQDPVDLSQYDWMPLKNLELGHEENTSKIDVKLLDVKYRVLLDRPIYEITTSHSGTRHIELRDGLTGGYLTPIDATLAKQIALNDFAEPTAVRSVERVEQTGPHSEYRGRELPAYRVELDHDSGTVIYISEARGAVVTRRNTRWRWFDFFWMLHTMDYQGRDNFNHWPLQVASLFGVSTVVSGFGLFITRTRWFRRRRRRRNRAAV